VSNPDPITAELIVTFADESALARATLAARAVAEGAALYRSTAPPWQLKAAQGLLSQADWRQRLLNLVEVLLQAEERPPTPGGFGTFWPDASFDEYQRRQAEEAKDGTDDDWDARIRLRGTEG
jgi:hypothetical protein